MPKKPKGGLEELHLKDLVADPENRRSHTARNIGMIVDSLQQVGASRSIVIDEANKVLAGNGVLESAGEAGITKVQVVEADGETIIAVRRRNLTDEQKRKLAIYDNRASELAEWNLDQLAKDLEAGLDLRSFWLSNEEARLLAGRMNLGKTDPDEAPPERSTDIVLGDMFQLGEHRLVCGDCTDPEIVARLMGEEKPFLMVTDPPYGVNYEPRWRLDSGLNKPDQKLGLGKVSNDDRADWRKAWTLFRGDIAYVWHGGVHAPVVAASLESCGFQIRSQIIWNKGSLVIGRSNYHWKHEPCWYAVRKGGKALWTGDRKQSTVWDIQSMHPSQGDVNDGRTFHSTQKPVDCMARAIRNHGDAGAVIYDPFVGSGTTLIACEQLSRRGRVCDIDPVYCQVSLDRWQNFTGQKAVKL